MSSKRKTAENDNEYYRQLGVMLSKQLQEECDDDGWEWFDARFKNRGADVLLVVRRESEKGDLEVSFSSGPGPHDALFTWIRRAEMDGTNWRPERPYAGS